MSNKTMSNMRKDGSPAGAITTSSGQRDADQPPGGAVLLQHGGEKAMNASGPTATTARRIVPGTGIPVDPADRQLWWADREAYAERAFIDLDQRRQYLDGQRRQLPQAADDVVLVVGTEDFTRDGPER